MDYGVKFILKKLVKKQLNDSDISVKKQEIIGG